jgi:hypothetical protein
MRMGAKDEVRGGGARRGAPDAPRHPDDEGRLGVEVDGDLEVSVDAADEDDPSGVNAEASDAGDDEPPTDAPLGLTTVRLPARGRQRGRPGTIF